MTQQNMDTNASPNKSKSDSAKNTAYGDPVNSSSPTINDEYKKATSAIAKSTQSGKNRKE